MGVYGLFTSLFELELTGYYDDMIHTIIYYSQNLPVVCFGNVFNEVQIDDKTCVYVNLHYATRLLTLSTIKPSL